MDVVEKTLAQPANPLFHARIQAVAVLVEDVLDAGHRNRTRQDDRADVGADTTQGFQRFDGTDLTRGHAQESDRLARQARGKSHVLDHQLDDAAEATVILRRRQDDAGGRPQRFSETLGIAGGVFMPWKR